MSKKTFTDLEMLDLSKNKYVKNVTSKGITYTNEFKLQFIAEYENGKTSRKIFEDAGFDVNIIVQLGGRLHEIYSPRSISSMVACINLGIIVIV